MSRKDVALGVLIAILLAVVLGPIASPWPDGLEKVAKDKGFMNRSATQTIVHAPVRDYLWPGVKDERVSTAMAGFAGTLIVFALGWGIGSLLNKRHRNP